MNNADCQRQRRPHAVLDVQSRRWKAEKIERLLSLDDGPEPVRLLEIGTGSGGIACYFANHARRKFEVTAVDVIDQRLVRDGYRFELVAGTALPFEDGEFDVVLTNHVIEHVGERDAQLAHLREVRRVMAEDGIGYLAVPNRWMVVEPHFRLAFLSWLPFRWRDAYVRLAGRGTHYDCMPLTLPELEALLREAGLAGRNRCVEALRATFEIERPGSPATTVLRKMPDLAFEAWLRLIPTLIYTIRHQGAAS